MPGDAEAELALVLAWCADAPRGVESAWDPHTDDPTDDPADGFPACSDPDWDAALAALRASEDFVAVRNAIGSVALAVVVRDLDSAELVPWPADGPLEMVVLRTPADPFRELDSRVDAYVETVSALADEVTAAVS
jgi:hypothetical protein